MHPENEKGLLHNLVRSITETNSRWNESAFCSIPRYWNRSREHWNIFLSRYSFQNKAFLQCIAKYFKCCCSICSTNSHSLVYDISLIWSVLSAYVLPCYSSYNAILKNDSVKQNRWLAYWYASLDSVRSRMVLSLCECLFVVTDYFFLSYCLDKAWI